jgi:hypothetical protein
MPEHGELVGHRHHTIQTPLRQIVLRQVQSVDVDDKRQDPFEEVIGEAVADQLQALYGFVDFQ